MPPPLAEPLDVSYCICMIKKKPKNSRLLICWNAHPEVGRGHSEEIHVLLLLLTCSQVHRVWEPFPSAGTFILLQLQEPS